MPRRGLGAHRVGEAPSVSREDSASMSMQVGDALAERLGGAGDVAAEGSGEGA
ncbi:hypothetical protein [Streptomyces sp. E2N166]|uniref:hypothetical protein n=1 Tax=Streptomyces sp. E2N166 TaxID=1851909 RepID=UPI00187D2DE0|nr:hypothetical protein [Streptomyces sp. E2N166]